jgi:hypothetical protein
MQKKFFAIFFCGIVLTFLAVTISSAKKDGKPRTFLLKIEHLALAKKCWKDGDPVITQSMNELIREAEKALSCGPYTVTARKHLPPSKDPHDFFVIHSRYWPNPKSINGLPWIRRSRDKPGNAMDRDRIEPMAKCVYTLALAYYFTGKNDYASHAASLLRTWFIDKTTRMNPNAKFGRVIPGSRKICYPVVRLGMVFRQVYDAAGILESASVWSDEDRNALQQWTREFMQWAETSRHGKNERKARNNHGTYYDLDMALQAMYIGDYDKARDMIQCYMIKRIPKQFKPDGSQPFEMIRINNYSYHMFNLEAAFDIAQLADHFDNIDMWNFETEKGAGLRRAIEFILPYLIDQWQWNYYKFRYFDIPLIPRYRLLRKASIGFNDPLFEIETESFPCLRGRYIIDLTYPEAALNKKMKETLSITDFHEQ